MIKQLRVTVDGKVYAVTVEMLDEGIGSGVLPVGASPPSFGAASVPVASPVVVCVPAKPAVAPSAGVGDVRSPLVGKVVAVDVKPGQVVTEGQQVMTLEAMKMNTYIYAPKTGRVSMVQVNPGDAVEEGAMLMAIA
jgi:biotin carboxyl carrier protein